MTRLKTELESCYAEDRTESLQIAQSESLAAIAQLKEEFCAREKELRDEIAELKALVAERNTQLAEAKDRSDSQVMQIRVILDRSEREHEREMHAEVAKREAIVGRWFVGGGHKQKCLILIIVRVECAESMRAENEMERQKMEEVFRERLTQVTEEFATELTNNQDESEARHKKKIGS